MNKEIENVIKQCETCQRVKTCSKNLSQHSVVPKTTFAFERINIDILEIPTIQ